jgi:hypothetical protein
MRPAPKFIPGAVAENSVERFIIRKVPVCNPISGEPEGHMSFSEHWDEGLAEWIYEVSVERVSGEAYPCGSKRLSTTMPESQFMLWFR